MFTGSLKVCIRCLCLKSGVLIPTVCFLRRTDCCHEAITSQQQEHISGTTSPYGSHPKSLDSEFRWQWPFKSAIFVLTEGRYWRLQEPEKAPLCPLVSFDESYLISWLLLRMIRSWEKKKSRASYGIQHKGLIPLLGHFSFKFPQQQGSIQ